MNDITAAKAMPVEPGATYVFDLGYYDYSWWAELHKAGCRIVTRLKANTPFEAAEERAVPADSAILSDRTGYLPKRLAGLRKNPLPDLVREVQVRIETGKVLRLFTNDMNASAEDIAALYKRRWEIELFFRWIKQTLKIKHFLGTSENAVRIQVTVALIAFMLLRLAHEANKIVESPLAFTRLIRANLMQRRTIRDLLQTAPPPKQPHPLLISGRTLQGGRLAKAKVMPDSRGLDPAIQPHDPKRWNLLSWMAASEGGHDIRELRGDRFRFCARCARAAPRTPASKTGRPGTGRL